ncbi:hypothetical protein DL93DRAFT_2164698 [Clavulina sp. PMI_390]|nr:hypothetical protein DL93DRAFT_2164698 [Clavulina sp. PMI_390]
MASYNEQGQGPSSGAEGVDGSSASYPGYQPATPGSGTPTPRQPLSQRESRNASITNAGSWPDASPLHHNEGTSYFSQPIQQQPQQYSQSGRISPTFTRRMHATASTPGPASGAGPSSYGQRPLPRRHSRSLQRSTSISSSRPRRRDTLLSEEDDDDDDNDDEDGDGEIVHERRHRSRDAGRRTPAPRGAEDDPGSSDDPEAEAARAEQLSESGSLDPVTLKERQSLINVEHPFGLPIWKPALYKKSRTVTRDAEHALHSDPSAAPEVHLLPGNVLWTLLFGWWLTLICFVVGTPIYLIPGGGKIYAKLLWGLGWYLFWPFGKYLEGKIEEESPENGEANDQDDEDDEDRGENGPGEDLRASIIEEDPEGEADSDASGTVRNRGKVSTKPITAHSTIRPSHTHGFSERSALLGNGLESISQSSAFASHIRTYGSAPLGTLSREREQAELHFLSTAVYFFFFVCIIAPVMLFVTMICWALVFTIPMAKLNWELLSYLFWHPLRIRFRPPPPAAIVPSPSSQESDSESSPPTFMVKQRRLRAGQVAPSGSPETTILLCIYRAVGSQYYKYTVGGVNILFVNLLPVVFFVIFDAFVLLSLKDEKERLGLPIHPFLAFIAARATIFGLSLASVIPLSYFIGMAVASISAQSSIGMGAVINATFGSIIEIILYAIALESGKGRLVEGSIVGSLLAGVLLMPGVSMIGGAMRKKEQRFNAKSAGVTSTMLIMAIIGTLTPTLFYQTYGEFTLICDGCPSMENGRPWRCKKCFYEHLDPATDPFYQETVKSLMYLCASILVFSYLIGLWFSLRTHASQIWQNPQQLMQQTDTLAPNPNRLSVWNKLTPADFSLPISAPTRPLQRQQSNNTITHSRSQSAMRQNTGQAGGATPARPASPTIRRIAPPPTSTTAPKVDTQPTPRAQAPATATGYTPILENFSSSLRGDPAAGVQPLTLPPAITADDFTRAVAVATVSALRHQQHQEALRPRGLPTPGVMEGPSHDAGGGGHGGHDAPSWSRMVSASVLMACTVLYAVIAEVLVDVVDVVLEGSGIDEKFLGVTLFALVPNTTEFMNAISFALNDNIALSMEIGSAYALQVCLLQIPAMVAFSAYKNPALGSIADSFTLIFPRWDVIAIILSIFLLTYTYIEAKANYYRGSILVLSYIVLTAGFFFAPPRDNEDQRASFPLSTLLPNDLPRVSPFSSLWVR